VDHGAKSRLVETASLVPLRCVFMGKCRPARRREKKGELGENKTEAEGKGKIGREWEELGSIFPTMSHYWITNRRGGSRGVKSEYAAGTKKKAGGTQNRKKK